MGRAGAARRRQLALARPCRRGAAHAWTTWRASAWPTTTSSISRSSPRRAPSAAPAKRWHARPPACGQAAAVPPLLTSFQPDALAGARQAAPELPRGLLLDSLHEGWLEAAQALECVAIVCNYALWNEALVQRVHAAGLRALSYTVNDEWAAQWLLGAGHRRHHHRPRRPVQSGGLSARGRQPAHLPMIAQMSWMHPLRRGAAGGPCSCAPRELAQTPRRRRRHPRGSHGGEPCAPARAACPTAPTPRTTCSGSTS